MNASEQIKVTAEQRIGACYTAIWIQCSYCIDAFGYKWWKQTEPKLDEVLDHLIKIDEYILSGFLPCKIDDGLDVNIDSFKSFIEELVSAALSRDQMPITKLHAYISLIEKMIEGKKNGLF